MLRSMLYVRIGSGCSRRVTASAARPSAARSRVWQRASASSGVSRSPASALSRGDMGFFRAGEKAFRVTAEQLQPAAFAGTKMKIQVVAEITQRVVRGQTHERTFRGRDLLQMLFAVVT